MEITIRRKQGVVILDLSGRIDMDAANLIEVVGFCVRNEETDVLCNLEGIIFIDYMGVSLIAAAYKEIINNNGRMRFMSMPSHLRGVFSVAGLEKFFEIYPSEELALNAFKEDKIIEKIKKKPLRRRFKRLPIELKVEFKIHGLKGAETIKAEILDLSALGAYIYGHNKFPLGEILDLKLKLPSVPKEIDLQARVVWLSDKVIQPQYHPGMGVEFFNISGSTQKMVLDFINKNLSLLASNQ